MSQSSKRDFAADRGSVLAEFAVILPIVLMMIVGAVDFGRVWVLASASANAAQAGAQYGAQSAPLSADMNGIRAAATSDLQSSALVRSGGDEGGMTIDDFTITPGRYCECSGGAAIACDDTCGGGAKPSVFVRVQIDAAFETIFDYPGLPSDIPVSRIAVMRAR
jgi:Flp pilus assembly protein TadG